MSNARREFRTETGKATRKARTLTLERKRVRTLKYNPALTPEPTRPTNYPDGRIGYGY